VTRLLQWLVTLLAAAAGFWIGVNQASPKVYRTDAGRVRIEIRAAWPGNLLEVAVPQVGQRVRLHPFQAPLEWRARTLTLTPKVRQQLRSNGRTGLAKLVLSGRNAALSSAARSFAYGAAGATVAALLVALVFILVFGGAISRLLIAVGAVLPLLALGALAYLVSGYGVTP
jgi:hypothetical protein